MRTAPFWRFKRATLAQLSGTERLRHAILLSEAARQLEELGWGARARARGRVANRTGLETERALEPQSLLELLNTTRLANGSEILSSVAVLVTLIFFVVEMRQNTAAIEASTRQAAGEADMQYLLALFERPEAQLTWTKPELTDEEVVLHYTSLVTFVRIREAGWAQYRSGVTDQATWERYTSSIAAVFRYPRNRAWWSRYGRVAMSDPGFVAEVDSIIDATPVVALGIADNYRRLIGGSSASH